MEAVGIIVLVVAGMVLFWAVLNQAVYRLARTARRGWDDGAPEPQGGSAEPPVPTAKRGS